MFTRIVVGDDGSPEGRDAVVLGATIARATGAGLTLLQSYSPSLIPTPGYTDRDTLTREAHAQLAYDRRLFAPEAHVDVVADTQPTRALVRHAESWHADLLVIGASQRAPLGHAAIGRTGRGLIEKAPTALAIAKRGLHQEGPRLARIAVGYDSGPESELALRYADEIAAGADAELLIEKLVRDPIPPLMSGGPVEFEELDALRESERLEALELCRGCAEHTTARSRADALVGDPGLALRALSDGVDLMVIGSRRWGMLARVVLGGVGETLASDCGTSLLITRRPPRHPDRMPLTANAREEEPR